MKRARCSATACAGIGLLGALALGCKGERPTDPERASTVSEAKREDLRPMLLPDLSLMTASVRTQLQESHDTVMRLAAAAEAPAADLGAAYGEVGKLLMAAQCYEAAEPYFSNARLLVPTDGRWAYYLGQLARIRGDLTHAVSYLEEALDRRPGDVATLIWLGEVHLMAGRPEAAEPPLRAALEKDGGSVAARYRLGRLAIARRDYAGAARHLEEALALAPNARGLHHPLGLTYRGLGDHARAEAHLSRGRALEGVAPHDPLMQELNELLNSSTAWEGRGVRELERADWPVAAAHFQRGVDLDPRSASLRHRLGTALYMMGDARAALREFEQAIALSPKHAQSHYSLGVLFETNGRVDDALQRYTAAVQHDPSYVEARVRLAGLLRQVGRPEASRAEYERVLAIDPRVPEAVFGHAMSLVASGRYRDARGRLEHGRQAYPGYLDFENALARVLAASPDASVRDGQKALAIVEALTDEQKRADGGEAMAMALAEVGRFGEAAAWQRTAISAAERAGQLELAGRMSHALRLYEKGQANRTPWRRGELP